ncbi:hypothetical protein [Ramlibacter sp. Leaf400]|uniref:hypothetical protein n=1 Tax=Ramlibacter sp. Leaf400 TaxID=1736365 RepID=UPI0006F2F339|nr:hypothetical protein [Ramlibacter sp. Leaf400]KQT10316.1 hypothetical protein ASG30_10750 [Ramlibacter sp. Leaf400]
MRSIHRIACVATIALAAGAALAQTSGTYSTGTGYSIDVRFGGNSLTVVEPNKQSEYRSTGPGVYEFTNPTNNIRYGLKVVDAKTLEAFKPGSGQPGTKLSLVSAAPAAAGNTGTRTAAPASSGDYRKFEPIAQGYLQRAQSDPANAQAWSFCGMAAMARAHNNDGANDAPIRQAAAALKSIATDVRQSPCPEVITPEIWRTAN